MHDAIPFWGNLTIEQEKNLVHAAAIKEFEAGDTIHAGEDDCSGLFIIMQGRVRAFIISETGKEITLYRLLERDICLFSASCIIQNINFEVMIEAETDARAILIPTLTVNTLLKQSVEASDYMNQLMASRFSDVMWVMEQVLFMSFDKRLAIFILEQANFEGSDTIEITHEAIARHLGSAREVVTRMLKYFNDEGMVELFRGGLTIKDRKKLTDLV
ncbi:MAG: Crp/Fnr family transcriptional regulator [Clostridiales bacterium]|nr:Crp/Fnr family transcriptional regulator [Clostridiales bacterium]